MIDNNDDYGVNKKKKRTNKYNNPNKNRKKRFSVATKQYRMWFPTMPIMMISARNAKSTYQRAWATFRVEPKMTKHEIKEYLTKIYNLPVYKVNTMNYDGKRKRVLTKIGPLYYKYKNYKKAIVTFDNTLTDVGLGSRVPELETPTYD